MKPTGAGIEDVGGETLLVRVSVTVSVSVADSVAVVVVYNVEVVLKTFVTWGKVVVLFTVLTTQMVVVVGLGYLVVLRVDVTVLVAYLVDVHRPFHDLNQSGTLFTERTSSLVGPARTLRGAEIKSAKEKCILKKRLR